MASRNTKRNRKPGRRRQASGSRGSRAAKKTTRRGRPRNAAQRTVARARSVGKRVKRRARRATRKKSVHDYQSAAAFAGEVMGGLAVGFIGTVIGTGVHASYSKKAGYGLLLSPLAGMAGGVAIARNRPALGAGLACGSLVSGFGTATMVSLQKKLQADPNLPTSHTLVKLADFISKPFRPVEVGARLDDTKAPIEEGEGDHMLPEGGQAANLAGYATQGRPRLVEVAGDPNRPLRRM